MLLLMVALLLIQDQIMLDVQGVERLARQYSPKEGGKGKRLQRGFHVKMRQAEHHGRSRGRHSLVDEELSQAIAEYLSFLGRQARERVNDGRNQEDDLIQLPTRVVVDLDNKSLNITGRLPNKALNLWKSDEDTLVQGNVPPSEIVKQLERDLEQQVANVNPMFIHLFEFNHANGNLEDRKVYQQDKRNFTATSGVSSEESMSVPMFWRNMLQFYYPELGKFQQNNNINNKSEGGLASTFKYDCIDSSTKNQEEGDVNQERANMLLNQSKKKKKKKKYNLHERGKILHENIKKLENEIANKPSKFQKNSKQLSKASNESKPLTKLCEDLLSKKNQYDSDQDQILKLSDNTSVAVNLSALCKALQFIGTSTPSEKFNDDLMISDRTSFWGASLNPHVEKMSVTSRAEDIAKEFHNRIVHPLSVPKPTSSTDGPVDDGILQQLKSISEPGKKAYWASLKPDGDKLLVLYATSGDATARPKEIEFRIRPGEKYVEISLGKITK